MRDLFHRSQDGDIPDIRKNFPALEDPSLLMSQSICGVMVEDALRFESIGKSLLRFPRMDSAVRSLSTIPTLIGEIYVWAMWCEDEGWA